LGGSVRLGLRCRFLGRDAVSLDDRSAEDVSVSRIAVTMFDQFGVAVNRR